MSLDCRESNFQVRHGRHSHPPTACGGRAWLAKDLPCSSFHDQVLLGDVGRKRGKIRCSYEIAERAARRRRVDIMRSSTGPHVIETHGAKIETETRHARRVRGSCVKVRGR